MKKITIFIIVICIIFIVLTNNISANEKKSWEYNWGKLWNGWSDKERVIYLIGYTDGLDWGGMVGSNSLSGVQLEFDLKVIIPAITGLYSDPSNTFIPLEAMTIIAYEKLKGCSFLEELIESAKTALGARAILITFNKKKHDK